MKTEFQPRFQEKSNPDNKEVIDKAYAMFDFPVSKDLYFVTVLSKTIYLSNHHFIELSHWDASPIYFLVQSPLTIRAVWYHLKFAYHDTIIRVSWYTLDIDTSYVHMINNLHTTARTPFMLRCNFIRYPMQQVWFKSI